MKTCYDCKQLKSLDNFYKNCKSKDGVGYQCKFCTKNEKKKRYDSLDSSQRLDYYNRNKDKRSKLHKKLRSERKLDFVSRCGGKCVDCGLEPSDTWPLACFDFHHKDGNEKDGLVSRLIQRADQNLAWLEVQKCIILCSNCHRRRHHLDSKKRVDAAKNLS